MKVMVILQCAYAVTEERRIELEDRTEWEDGLWNSHTGRRLKTMIPDGVELYVINASRTIGVDSNAIFPPDSNYILEEYSNIQPDIVLACGVVAQTGAASAGIEYIAAPHPAWRRLSIEKCTEIENHIREMMNNMR